MSTFEVAADSQGKDGRTPRRGRRALADEARADREALAAQARYDRMTHRMVHPSAGRARPERPDGEARAATRRRGSELDDAIVGAAWDELVAVGFDGLTYDGVARRAQTTRSVIYRRWPTLQKLASAAIVRSQEFRRAHVPDTGSLRDDIVASLSANSMTDARLALASFLFAGHFRGPDGEVEPAEVPAQDSILAPEIFLRAQRRGQVDLTGLPESVLKVPTALLIGRMLETLQPPSSAEIDAIVDEIFFPLLRAYGALPSPDSADQLAL